MHIFGILWLGAVCFKTKNIPTYYIFYFKRFMRFVLVGVLASLFAFAAQTAQTAQVQVETPEDDVEVVVGKFHLMLDVYEEDAEEEEAYD